MEKKNLATIGSFGKRRIDELDALIGEHGYDDVDRAIDAVIAEGFGPDVKSKAGVTLHRLPAKIEKLKAAGKPKKIPPNPAELKRKRLAEMNAES